MLLRSFYQMFPDYYQYRVPMHSNWKRAENSDTLEIVAPGFTKNDFKLVVSDEGLDLKITDEKRTLSYSLVDNYFKSKYKLDEAKAKYRGGILYVEIPKVEIKKLEIGVS